MALIDSAAAFKAHCDKIDESGELAALFERNDLRTFADLGYAVGTPQAPPSEGEFKDFSVGLNNNIEPTLAQISRIRRIHFESCTMVVAHLKSQVSQETSLDVVRKLPAAEKLARLEKQKARLAGVAITGELQPSFALTDLVASMAQSNSVFG